MTREEIDNYFQRHFSKLDAKAKSIWTNLANEKGEHSDLVQEGYLELINKCEKITTDKEAEAFFVRFVSSQICWRESKHNKELVHCTGRILHQKNAGVTVSESDEHGTDPDLREKMRLEKWASDMNGLLELYKQRSTYNRRLVDLYIRENGDTAKMSDRLMVSVYNVRRMVRKMKDELAKMRKMKDNFLVVGCGPSVSQVRKKIVPACVIGVNDAARHIDLDHLVCVDPAPRFSDERLAHIQGCEAPLYTHLEKLNTLGPKTLLEFNAIRGFHPFGKTGNLPKSHHSTFVAICLAYRMGAKTIAVAGMDLVGHPDFTQQRKMHETRKHLSDLCNFLNMNGVKIFNLGPVDNVLGNMPGVQQMTYTEWVKTISTNPGENE